MKNILPLIVVCCTAVLFCAGQQRNNVSLFSNVFPGDTIPAVVIYKIEGDSVRFSSKLRPLRQLAGAPAAFYTYFWDFGDGAFSFEETPVHRYSDAGLYFVRLYATNYFDDGQSPPARPCPVMITRKPQSNIKWTADFFSPTDKNIKLKVNTEDHRPGEDFVVLMGYQNKLIDTLEGTLVLFFNERQYKENLFALSDRRMYKGEQNSSLKEVAASLKQSRLKNELYAGIDENHFRKNRKKNHPGRLEGIADNGLDLDNIAEEQPGDDYYYDNTSSASELLKSLKEKYTESSVVSFKNLQHNQQNFLLMTLKTLPTNALQDSNATITISALLIPKDTKLQPEQFNLDMQIAASHDPNRLLLKPHFVNYRFLGKKKQVTYTVQFENLGKGPAKSITVDVAMPKQMNMATFEIKDMSPKCTWCSTAYNRQSCIDTIRTPEGIRFMFKNIYLPGMQQKLVSNKDSTKGFIEYAINFSRRPKKKKPFYSTASIVFDQNKSIVTNRATTRFLPGLSPGIMAGYDFSLSNGSYSAKGPVKIGFSISPYAPSKPYFQFELFTGLFEKEDNSVMYQAPSQPYDTIHNVIITDTEVITTSKRNFIELVPLHFRYNINNWLGIGAGVIGKVLISETLTSEQKLHAFYETQFGNRDTVISVAKGTKVTNSRSFWDGANIGTFVDIQAGMVRTTGPAIGLRYIRQWRGNINNHFFVYATFRL